MQVLGEHAHARAVGGEEVVADPALGDARLLRLEHGGVHLALRGRPLAGQRERAGDVGGVDLLGLDAHVGQQEVTGTQVAVVAPPVQGRAVRPGPDDRRVADLVALQAGTPPERALEPALATHRTVEDQRDLAHDVGEAPRRRVAGVLQAGDLPVVLGQAQLVDDRRELLAGAAGEQGIDDGVVPGQQGALLVAPCLQGARELGQRAAVEGQDLAGLGRGGDVAHPDRAELVVGEVPLRSGVVVLADVERGVVAGSGRPGRHDQDGALDRLARQPDEGRRRPERVLRVVGTRLQQARGDDDQLAGEVLGEGRPARGRVRGDARALGGVGHPWGRLPVVAEPVDQVRAHRRALADRRGSQVGRVLGLGGRGRDVIGGHARGV